MHTKDKLNESKQLKKQNTHTRVFDTHDEGLWAESQTPSEFKRKSDKKGKEVLETWKFKKLYASLNIYNVWVYIITSALV